MITGEKTSPTVEGIKTIGAGTEENALLRHQKCRAKRAAAQLSNVTYWGKLNKRL